MSSGSILRPASCHGASLTSALDPFVAVLVVFLKVLEKFVVISRYLAMLRELNKHVGEFLECWLVKVVLVSLKIPPHVLDLSNDAYFCF